MNAIKLLEHYFEESDYFSEKYRIFKNKWTIFFLMLDFFDEFIF